jgi:hypothetical protein
LHTRLAQSTVGTAEARTISNDLLALKDDLLIEGYEVDTARQTLSNLGELKDELARADEQTEKATAAMSRITSLQTSLAAASDSSLAAQLVGDRLLMLQQDLACQQDQLEPAEQAADRLVSLRTRLASEGDQIAYAQQQVDGLLVLKDTVVGQTRDLADAIETLEVTADLHEQFHETVRNFEQMRSWMVELVMLQPTLQRAMVALEPLTELGNLRRVSDDRLREIGRAMRQKEGAQLARQTSLGDEAGQAAIAE